jgi:hypothetical protein
MTLPLRGEKTHLEVALSKEWIAAMGAVCRPTAPRLSGRRPVRSAFPPHALMQMDVFQVTSRSSSSLMIGQAPSDQFEMTV